MKVTPGICMKTKEGKNRGRQKPEVRSPMFVGSGGSDQVRHSTSCLLTPVSCSCKNEGDSGDIYENKRGGKIVAGKSPRSGVSYSSGVDDQTKCNILPPVS